MRMIGHINDETHAQRFSDYLVAQGVPNLMEVPPGGGGWQVWIEHDDHIDRARAELRAFEEKPDDPRYRKAVNVAETVRSEAEKREKRRREQFVDVRTSWSGAAGQRIVPVTLVLIALSLVIGLATQIGAQMNPVGDILSISAPVRDADGNEGWIVGARDWPGRKMRLTRPLALLPEVASGQVWRVITPIFLHFGPLHLVFNLYWLFFLGSQIERIRGSVYLGLLVLGAAIFSNWLQWVWAGPGFGGMSGVVYAVFGYVWVKSMIEPYRGFQIERYVAIVLLIWMALGMIEVIPRIANGAHLGGLIVGVVVAYAPNLYKRLRGR